MNSSSCLAFGRKRVPIVLQTEAAECGLACLAMIAGWYGHRTDLAALRARFLISLKGVNLNHLVQYANRLDLSSRALRLDVNELDQLALPCILHWDLSHFVVLVAVSRRGIIIHDPAIGVRSLPYSQVEKYFTGVALELAPVAGFAPVNDRRRVSLMALMGKVEGLWRTFSLIFGMALAFEVLGWRAPSSTNGLWTRFYYQPIEAF